MCTWEAGAKALLQDKALLENDGKTETGDEERENKQCPSPPTPAPALYVWWGSETHRHPFFAPADLFEVDFNHEKQGGSQQSKGANKATRLLQGLLWSEATWATATKRGYLASASSAFDSWLCYLLAVQCEQIKDLSEPQTLST